MRHDQLGKAAGVATLAVAAIGLVAVPAGRAPLVHRGFADRVAWWADGARWTFLTGALVLTVALSLGVTLGGLAGLGPPVFRSLLRRLVELSGALPTVLLVIVAQSIGSIAPWVGTALVISATRSVEVARIVCVRSDQLRADDFVLAARATGKPLLRTLRTELVPHVMPAALVSAAFAVATVVSVEAAVTYLGLGSAGARATWGGWLGEAAREGDFGAMAWPAASITVTTAALYTLAELADRRLRSGQALVSLAGSHSRTK